MIKTVLTYVAAFLCAASCAWAQTSAGTVSGTVRDATSAVIPNAQVALVSAATNVRSTTVSNEAGFYRLAGVAPGRYVLSAESPGMQKYEGNIVVQVGQSLVIDPTLHPSGTATTVDVKDVEAQKLAGHEVRKRLLARLRRERIALAVKEKVFLLPEKNTPPGS